MEGGFSYGDIIVIGVIAAFILLRYRAMLGEKTGRDTTQTPAPMNEFERVIQLPAAKMPAMELKKDDLAAYGSLAEQFVAMRAIDREFSPDEFMMGARAAFEMVIESFTKADRDTLKMLLSPELYKSFDQSLTDARAAGRINATTLVAITKADITEAKLSGTVATITVDFVSEQIQLIRDPEGKILEGDPSEQHRVEDNWVFTRNLASADPNWKIIES